jgi:hypothetical protein
MSVTVGERRRLHQGLGSRIHRAVTVRRSTWAEWQRELRPSQIHRRDAQLQDRR